MVSDRAFREKEGLELIIQDTLQVLGQPSDPLLADQWHTGTDTWSINVRDVWDDYTGAGVLVGILDDGFDYTHPDLAPNYRFDLDYDFLDNDRRSPACRSAACTYRLRWRYFWYAGPLG